MSDQSQIDVLKQKIDKLQYHVRLLMEDSQINSGSYARIAIGLDWSERTITEMLDVFDECDQARDTSSLEPKLRRLGASYQYVKSIVLTVWKNGQYSWVCQDYAINHKCAEFDRSGIY
jgi:hypothetical protein